MTRRIVVSLQMTIEIDDDTAEQQHTEHELSIARCPLCGWSRPYNSPAAARRGYAAHKYHCQGDKSEANGKDIMDKWFRSVLGE